MKVQLTKQLLDAIIAAYNKVNTPIEASDIDTLILGVPFIKVNNTLIEWELVNLSMQQLLLLFLILFIRNKYEFKTTHQFTLFYSKCL